MGITQPVYMLDTPNHLHSTPWGPLNAILLKNVNIYNLEVAQRGKTNREGILRLLDIDIILGSECVKEQDE